MVKGKKIVKRKKKSIPRSYRADVITPYGQRGGAAAKKLAKEVFESKLPEARKLKRWPKDCVPDDRWCSWLPDGWTCATKMTCHERLLDCYIGPIPDDPKEERMRFFHKADMEKALGKKLENDARGPKPRTVPKDLADEFPEEGYIVRTDKPAEAQYINDRCKRLHGMRVKDAIVNFKYKRPDGIEHHYGVSDLKYDKGGGRLTISMSKPTGAAPTPQEPRRKTRAAAVSGRSTRARPVAKKTKTSNLKLAKSCRSVTAVSSSAASSSATSGKGRAAQSIDGPSIGTKRKHPSGAQVSSTTRTSTSSPMAASSAQNTTDIMKHVAKNIFAPFKSRAARSVQDEVSIKTLLGVAISHGFDQIIIDAFPNVLRQAPGMRGPLANATMKQLEAEFTKRGAKCR